MTDLLATEYEELSGDASAENQGMGPDTFQSLVSDMVSDAEQWIQADISPSRTRAQRYYQGEVDLNSEENRSQFVARVVRDTVEQTVPQAMKLYTGSEYLVSFSAKDVNEQVQSAAADATEAFHHIFFHENEGWCLLEGITRDALKAKTGILKVYIREETTVRQVEWQGTEPEFAMMAARDDVIVNESRLDVMRGIAQDPYTGQPMEVEQRNVDATLTVKATKARIAIDTVAPEDFLINRSATGTKLGYFNLIGEHAVRTVSDAVEMGIDYDTAVKWSGNGDGSATGDYMDQERRARRSMSRDPYQEQVFQDPTMAPLTMYELYVRVDMDGDGHAELRRVIALGKDVGEVVENEIVDDHPYCVGSAISTEHSVIGESMADNVMDIQDQMTQLTRNLNNNQGYVNNPRPIYTSPVKLSDVLDNRLGAPISGPPGSIDFLQWPDITPTVLASMQYYEEVLAGRTGISRESQGLDAKNLQASSEVGVLAILGAGMTQPEMIVANLAHRCIAPCAVKVVNLLRQNYQGPMPILSQGSAREVSPSDWPEDMAIRVRVGLATGTREEKIQALTMTAADQKGILWDAYRMTGSFDNPWVTPEQYARTKHQLIELTRAGQSTEYYQSPEEVRNWMAMDQQRRIAAAKQPPRPSEKVQTEMIKADTKLKDRQMAEESDILQTQMKVEADLIEVEAEAELSRELNREADLG